MVDNLEMRCMRIEEKSEALNKKFENEINAWMSKAEKLENRKNT